MSGRKGGLLDGEPVVEHFRIDYDILTECSRSQHIFDNLDSNILSGIIFILLETATLPAFKTLGMAYCTSEAYLLQII